MDQLTHLTVLHEGKPLKPLPECFSTGRRRRHSCPMLFKTVYLLRGNVKANTMILEKKHHLHRGSSDNYTILYDMNKMTMIRRGWSGTFGKKTTEPLKSNPLAEFMAQWRGHYLDPATPCFWQPPGFSEPRNQVSTCDENQRSPRPSDSAKPCTGAGLVCVAM